MFTGFGTRLERFLSIYEHTCIHSIYCCLVWVAIQCWKVRTLNNSSFKIKKKKKKKNTIREPTTYLGLRTVTGKLIECTTMDEQHGSTYGHKQLSMCSHLVQWTSTWKYHTNRPKPAKTMATAQVLQLQPRRPHSSTLPCPKESLN
jgi:hypothetical protein